MRLFRETGAVIPSNADNERENGVAGISAPLSIEAFRSWLDSRPDREHWELIAGVPMMMASPTKAHQRIVANLDSLLRDALKKYRSEWTSYQSVGLNLSPVTPDYDPEPDVVVVDADPPGPDDRYSDRFYLAAEIVSASDKRTVENKRDVYKRHPDCRCVLVIEQHRVQVSLSILGRNGWTEQHLTKLEEELVLEDFGLRCTLAELYRDTSLERRQG
ncbi:MAG: Uma2 family endonuclease [Alphaproteobacteria bacterium]